MHFTIRFLLTIFDILVQTCDQDGLKKVSFAFHQQDEAEIDESLKREIEKYLKSCKRYKKIRIDSLNNNEDFCRYVQIHRNQNQYKLQSFLTLKPLRN